MPPVVELPAVDDVKDDDTTMDAAVDVQDGRTSFSGGSKIGILRVVVDSVKIQAQLSRILSLKDSPLVVLQIYLLQFGLRFFLLLEPKHARMILLKLC
jgi:hypothetical protein